MVTVTLTVGATIHYWLIPQGVQSSTGAGIVVPGAQYGWATVDPVTGANTSISWTLDPAFLWDVRIESRGAPPVLFEGFAPQNGDLLEQLALQGWVPL